MNTFRAIVTPAGGTPVEVEYPADSPQPTRDAVRAAAGRLGVPGFAREPAVEHFRDGGPEVSATPPAAWEPRRVEFVPSDGGEAASVWVAVRPCDGGSELKLRHEYPDFRPAVGWQVRGLGEIVGEAGGVYTVTGGGS